MIVALPVNECPLNSDAPTGDGRDPVTLDQYQRIVASFDERLRQRGSRDPFECSCACAASQHLFQFPGRYVTL